MPVVLHLGVSMDVKYRWGLGNAITYCSGLHLPRGNLRISILFGNTLLPFSVVQESIEGFEEDLPKVHQSPPLGHISQVKALVPTRICLLNCMALISFPPCCVEEERGPC